MQQLIAVSIVAQRPGFCKNSPPSLRVAFGVLVQLLDILLTSLALRSPVVLNADWLPVVLGDDKNTEGGCELGMAPSLRAFAESYN